jgi:hypothetical protein
MSTKFPPHVVEKYVKRHLADPKGEPVRRLAREVGISVPGFYLWLGKHKDTKANAWRRERSTESELEDLHIALGVITRDLRRVMNKVAELRERDS